MGKKKDRIKGDATEIDGALDESGKDVESIKNDAASTDRGKSKKKKASKLELLKQEIEKEEKDNELGAEDLDNEMEKEEVCTGSSKKKGKSKTKKKDAEKKSSGLIDDKVEEVTQDVAACRFDYSSNSEEEKDQNESNEKGMQILIFACAEIFPTLMKLIFSASIICSSATVLIIFNKLTYTRTQNFLKT